MENLAFNKSQRLREPWPGLSRTSKIESFPTVVNGFQPLTVVTMLTVLDVSDSPNYPSATNLASFDIAFET